jgi:hypothetical protein
MVYSFILGSLKMKTTEGGAAWGFKMRTLLLKIAFGEMDKILSADGEFARVLVETRT